MNDLLQKTIRPATTDQLADQAGAPLNAVEEYWTSHNVTNHQAFNSVQDSIDNFHWRNAQEFHYIELMPVSKATGLRVLDFGCGPGTDLVGFAIQSAPARLVGVDVSKSSLAEARQRLSLHCQNFELYYHDINLGSLPFDDGSFDLVHTSGVLHHMPDVKIALAELRRVLTKGGIAQIMVYNYWSVWVHLYVAYLRQIVQRINTDDELMEAFRVSTDGPQCPISRAYRCEDFVELAREAGFRMEKYDVAVGVFEMSLLPKRFDAIMDQNLRPESRDFLTALTFDSQGLPLFDGVHAGINGCYRFCAV